MNFEKVSFDKIDILPGRDSAGEPEEVGFSIEAGETVAIVGPTGSGKSQLLWDIETLANGQSRSGRVVLIDGKAASNEIRRDPRRRPVAVVSQSMSFTIDRPVHEFLMRHASIRGKEKTSSLVGKVISSANKICGEPIDPELPLSHLSGGQSRALMVADVAIISSAPIVLVDEVENAGIDRKKAIDLLSSSGKMTLVVTHDPVQALSADKRVVMRRGGIREVLMRSKEEEQLLEIMSEVDSLLCSLRSQLRVGRATMKSAVEQLSQILERSEVS